MKDILLLIDGEYISTLADMIEANVDDEDTCAECTELAGKPVGTTITLGGGACGDTTVEKVDPEAIKICPNSDILLIQPKEGTQYTLEELQAMVDGPIEIIHSWATYPTYKRGYLLIANEEGIMRQLPYNATVAALTGIPLYGTAIIIPSKSLS